MRAKKPKKTISRRSPEGPFRGQSGRALGVILAGLFANMFANLFANKAVKAQ
jgi:hypothetical protein